MEPIARIGPREPQPVDRAPRSDRDGRRRQQPDPRRRPPKPPKAPQPAGDGHVDVRA